ncbi:hypothetical protein BURPS406E_C1732 [Burkholderia pseudomallei 406e]|nr:hypothetical protein BURPS305_1578 [Burkholderia pseudomallei 305]EDO88751.1 hypothetical protein BURPS406E_C1732 [Burkholderia pseudomallei 406e]EDO94508.1 hypothetical protein BURPSPAST_V0162 [Burkholderia pseudomallei Pasteur 52237]EDS82922.1 hypothetical protein BURPSS13_K0308 [Burkholderia pseudomallei S13]EDU11263.1 hypothetical protein BURPS1655_I0910 [Burkholderia pseudomallei 1655]EEH25470.1 conserved hypothetical protein [Burkholderia pseudomallei Pakistan 9]
MDPHGFKASILDSPRRFRRRCPAPGQGDARKLRARRAIR